MRSVLADGGFDDDCQALGYAPHVTLAVYPDDAPASRLRRAVQAEAMGWAALPIALAGIEIFLHPFPVVSYQRPSALTVLAGAVAALLPLWRPLEAWLDQVDLVRFRPAEVLWSRRLTLTP